MFLQLAPLALCLLAASAQDSGIVDTIGEVADLSSFANYLGQNSDFASWLEGLQDVTVLAPNNAAFERVSLANDDTTSLERLRYHVLNGTHNDFGSGELQHINTELRLSHGGTEGDAQIIAAKTSIVTNTTTFWSGLQNSASTVGEPVPFAGGLLYVVDELLQFPQSFAWSTEQEGELGGPAFAAANIPRQDSDGSTTIDQLSGITVFLPMNYSFEQIGNVIEDMTKAELDRVLSYHILNEVINIDLDAPPVGSYMTMEGSAVSIFVSKGDTFVNNARIVGQGNWVFSGGVIYTIYGVLNPDNSTVDPDIVDAEIAFEGASYTDSFTFPGQSNGDSIAIGGDEGSSGTNGLSTGAKAGIAVGVVLTVLIALGGAAMWFIRRRRANTYIKRTNSFPLAKLSPTQQDLPSSWSLPSQINHQIPPKVHSPI